MLIFYFHFLCVIYIHDYGKLVNMELSKFSFLFSWTVKIVLMVVFGPQIQKTISLLQFPIVVEAQK